MRKAFSKQLRLDCPAVVKVALNYECRDEIVPILRAMQEIAQRPELREKVLVFIEHDVCRTGSDDAVRDDAGREGLSYWEILVLSSVRLGCNLNYDKLQDLAENHRNLRHVMGVGDWQPSTRSPNDAKSDFNWRRIHDNDCWVQPSTLEKINQLVVDATHELVPDAARTARADSFVIETNIHWPSESSLLLDGWEQIHKRALPLVEQFGGEGWRQHEHRLRKVKRMARNIARLASKRGPNYVQRMRAAYGQLIKSTRQLLQRAEELCTRIQKRKPLESLSILAGLRTFMQRTEQVLSTAHRRVIKREYVPNGDKLFSMFEPHTQLYKRGKAGSPVQFGRQLLVYEDGAGMITHYHLLARDKGEKEVVVEQTRALQTRLNGRLKEVSFDRGFHSVENQTELEKIVEHVCLPKPGAKQAAVQENEADEVFLAAKQRHSGVESAIGALQSGNGCQRCRDRSELGLERYVSLAILGRNLHTFGKLLIAHESPKSCAAQSQRKKVA
jgi:transposase, IS5 family